jgi:hypothetical protein
VIVDTGREVFGARTGAECSKWIGRAAIPEGEIAIPVIDSSAEGFAYYPDSQVVSVMAVKKRWTKSEIVEVYNSRKPPGHPAYVPGSLSNKPVERLVSEIVDLLVNPNHRLQATRMKPRAPEPER